MIVCSTCGKRDAPSYFKVVRVAQDGTESPLTVTCSVKCLLSWSYQYATLQGTRALWTAKAALRQLFAKPR